MKLLSVPMFVRAVDTSLIASSIGVTAAAAAPAVLMSIVLTPSSLAVAEMNVNERGVLLGEVPIVRKVYGELPIGFVESNDELLAAVVI